MKALKTTLGALAALLVTAAAAAAFPATSTTDLNVRAGPGTDYPVVDQLEAGDVVDVASQQNGWYRLAGGGWVSASYLDAGGGYAPEPYYEPEPYYGPSYSYGYYGFQPRHRVYRHHRRRHH